MEWIKDIMETFLAPTVSGILLFIIAKVGKAVVDFIKRKIADIDSVALQGFIRVAANEVVLYVQQKYKTLSDTEKFDKALGALEMKIDNFTEKLKLGREIVSQDDLAIAVEASVKSLKDNWGN